MEALGKLNCRHKPLLLSIHHRPQFTRPVSSLSFRILPPSRVSFSIKSSSSSSSSSDNLLPNAKVPKPQILPNLPFSVLKTTVIAAIAASAIFFSRSSLKQAISSTISPPLAAETTEDESISDEVKEKTLEEHLDSYPDDVEALRALMEEKIKSRKIEEAIRILEQLIVLEPNDTEWPLLKAHMYCSSGELGMAKLCFNEILSKEPLRVDAYHGLVMSASQSDGGRELKETEKKIAEAMEICKKEKKKEEFRDFKLLIAQIRVIEGNHNDALKVYQELVKEEPRDFRPYLCQGIIYTLLKKKDEAEKNFEKYRRLVPNGHPYARYFDDNMLASKVFAQKVENERAGSS